MSDSIRVGVAIMAVAMPAPVGAVFEGGTPVATFNDASRTDGTCAPPSVPLYRLYNNGSGGAPNHRYTTQTDVRTQMIGQGWTPEGLGIGVVACVPA